MFDIKAIDFEPIVETIQRGLFNEMMRRWDTAIDRSIINYIFSEKADIKKASEDLGFEEDFIKMRIIHIISHYDSLCNFANHESFSRRGR